MDRDCCCREGASGWSFGLGSEDAGPELCPITLVSVLILRGSSRVSGFRAPQGHRVGRIEFPLGSDGYNPVCALYAEAQSAV